MNRRLILPIILVMLIISATVPFLSTTQASSGCGSVGGLSGFLGETLSRSTGTAVFSSGETISVKVTGAGGTSDVQLVVGGSSQTGSGSVSYTIPSDGKYNVSVTNISTGDYTVNVSCNGSGSSNPPWGGFTDGRLNPEMAENYSLWCLHNNLDIYRAPNNVGELIISIPLTKILGITVGKSVIFKTKAGPITIERLSSDVVLVKGNNGTNGPAFTQKFFTITECIVRNGSVPSTPLPKKPTRTPLPPKPTPLPPTSTPTPVPPTATIMPNPAGTAIVQPGSNVGNLIILLVELGPPDPSKDGDGDGIRNTLDLCPDVSAPGMAFGCPDDDGDGLSNPVDQCPNAAGTMSGCPDTDGDGVSDLYDLCPNFVPASDKPSVYGCLDSDGDGFPNGFFPGTTQPMDWCPVNAGEPGVILFMGCPDPDGDGFLSSSFRLVPAGYQDECPRYPLPWNLADGPCPDTTSVAAAPPDPTVALFLYANLVGAYDNLAVPSAAEEIQVCTTASYLFCGW